MNAMNIAAAQTKMRRMKKMNKYRVTAHVTICVEMDITASCRDEANMKFAEKLEENYGWADYDEVHIKKIGDEE